VLGWLAAAAAHWATVLMVLCTVNLGFPLNASKELFCPWNFCLFDLHFRDIFIPCPLLPRAVLRPRISFGLTPFEAGLLVRAALFTL
jgi:hypothetical protein